MTILKKLSFAPFFLICLTILLAQLSSILKSDSSLFSLDFSVFIQFLILVLLLNVSAFFFVLLAAFSADFKFIVPTAFLSSLLPFLFVPIPDALFLSTGIFISQIITFAFLKNSLKSYLTFNPNSVFGPSIRYLTTFLIITICAVYFISTHAQISQKGFQIPDSLLDTSLDLTSGFEQTGLDQSVLDNFNQPKEFTKQLVKDQSEKFLQPYVGIIAPLLSLFFFLTLQSLSSIVNFFMHPLLWITFYILEKTGFVTFTEEARPVKKMVT